MRRDARVSRRLAFVLGARAPHVRRVCARVFRAHAHDAIVAVGAQREGARARGDERRQSQTGAEFHDRLTAPPRARVVDVADAQRRGGVLAQGGERARLGDASRESFGAVPHRGARPRARLVPTLGDGELDVQVGVREDAFWGAEAVHQRGEWCASGQERERGGVRLGEPV